MDEIAIYDSLQECLLTDEEMEAGLSTWEIFEDPFPRVERDNAEYMENQL